MANVLHGSAIALLATDGFEDSELLQPLVNVQEAGANVVIVSNKKGKITGKDGTKVKVGFLAGDVNAADFDGLLLPGGVHNPDVMRTEKEAIQFVKEFFTLQKPVAAICHAPWLLIEADVVRDRTVTSWPSLKTDLINAGAAWVDEAVVVDGKLVTSRNPDDLDAFCTKAIETFAQGMNKTYSA